jgi:branched-subunit amino acid aminotransferase/4-amino-4-deoxychorismate lyase
MTPTEKILMGFMERCRLSHVVSYGSSVFEGVRCYETPAGPAIFRLREHTRRLIDSAKIYRIENIGYSVDELCEAQIELVRLNGLRSCYIRPRTAASACCRRITRSKFIWRAGSATAGGVR